MPHFSATGVRISTRTSYHITAPLSVGPGAFLGFTLGFPAASTGTVTFHAGSSVRITGTPTLPSHTLMTASAIPGLIPVPDPPVSGYQLQVEGGTILKLVRVGSGFTTWISGTFANGPVPAGQQGPEADPDRDGIPNLIEYAIAGQDPTAPNPIVGTLTGLTLSFAKRPGTSGLTYLIEDSGDLGRSDPWAQVTGGGYVNNSVTISFLPAPPSPARNFVRLKITQTP